MKQQWRCLPALNPKTKRHWRDPEPRGVVRLAAATGHAGCLQRDPGAGYLMDQSWHIGWIAVAAFVAAAGRGKDRAR